MELSNDFNSAFAVKAAVAADWSICLQASAEKQNTQVLLTSTSEQANSFSSYCQEVIISQGTQCFFKHIFGNCLWGKKERQILYTYQILLYLLQRYDAFNVKEPPIVFFFCGYIHFYVPTQEWQTFCVKSQMINTADLAPVINYSTVLPTYQCGHR